MKRTVLLRSAPLLLLLVLTGCASLDDLIATRQPTAEVERLRLEALDFSGATLVAEIRIDNPNPVGVSLASLDWELEVEDQVVLSGTQPAGLQIAASASQTIEVPVAFTFRELRETVERVGGAVELSVGLAVTAGIDVPVLGVVSIPLQQTASIPVPQLPTVALREIRIERLTLTGADMRASFRVTNPNVFAVDLQEFSYGLSVQGREWTAGVARSRGAIVASGDTIVDVSFGLNLLDLGRSVVDILRNAQSLSVALEAQTVIQPDHPLVPRATFPVSLNASVPIRR